MGHGAPATTDLVQRQRPGEKAKTLSVVGIKCKTKPLLLMS